MEFIKNVFAWIVAVALLALLIVGIVVGFAFIFVAPVVCACIGILIWVIYTIVSIFV